MSPALSIPPRSRGADGFAHTVSQCLAEGLPRRGHRRLVLSPWMRLRVLAPPPVLTEWLSGACAQRGDSWEWMGEGRMSDAASLPASGLLVWDGVELWSGRARAPVLQLTSRGPVPREDWMLGGWGVVPMWLGRRSRCRRAAQSPSSPPASAALGSCVSISAASQGGACGVSKCRVDQSKGWFKRQRRTNVCR